MGLSSSVLLSCGHSADIVQNGIKRTRATERTTDRFKAVRAFRVHLRTGSPECASQFNLIGMRHDVA